MSNIYFIGDTHFGEEDVFRTSGEAKEFYACSAKDLKIKSKWNNIVQKDDTVFILGDFGIPCYAKELNGKKILVRGNHDTYEEDYNQYFDAVYDYPILYEDFFILSHDPKYVSEDMPYANIFAHVHNNPTYRTVSPRSFCVSACRIDYVPIRCDEIIEKMMEADNER